MEEKQVLGYKVYEDGTILNLNGKPKKNSKSITIKVGNKKYKSVSYARLVYYAFHQNDFDVNNYSYHVEHKDGNKDNNAIDNLYITNNKKFLWGENHKKSKLSIEDMKEIKRLYSIGQKKNEGQNTNNPFKKYSYRKLAEMYGVSFSRIKQIVERNDI